MNRFLSLAFVLPLLAFAVAQPSASAPVAQDEDFAFEVGTEAYVYAFPLMMMEMTRFGQHDPGSGRHGMEHLRSGKTPDRD